MLALLLLAQAAPMMATPAVDCSKVRVALPQSLLGWGRPVGEPTIGRAFTISATKPSGGPSAVTKRPGNVAATKFHVVNKATYSVALDQPAWIDVASAGVSLTPVAHRHGPACTGIRKIVDFSLAPGDYALTVSGVTAASVKVLIAPAG